MILFLGTVFCLALTYPAVTHFGPAPAYAHIGTPVYPIVFPVRSHTYYTDTFGDRRSGGRTHEGADILAPKGTRVLAAAPGHITWLGSSSRGGYSLELTDEKGTEYVYVHLNNDNPGTDDGLGGPELAYAPGIERGTEVRAGEVLGYVGDSGNAENSPSHLHFEIHPSGGDAVCPNPSLAQALPPGTLLSALAYTEPAGAALEPNPLAPNGDGYRDLSRFSYRLDRKAAVTIKLYLPGGSVREIVSNKQRAPGSWQEAWTGTGFGGKVLPTGSYAYEILVRDGESGLAASATGTAEVAPHRLPGGGMPEFRQVWVYPNPFSPLGAKRTTSFCYTLVSDAIVTLKVFDYRGEVKTIVNNRYRPAGRYYEGWTGGNIAGKVVRNGNYRYTILTRNAEGEFRTEGIVGVAP